LVHKTVPLEMPLNHKMVAIKAMTKRRLMINSSSSPSPESGQSH